MQIPSPPTIDELKRSKTSLFGNMANDFLPGNYAIKMFRNDYPIYFAKQFSFPAMRLSPVPVAINGGIDFKVPGEKIEYDEITIMYRMDEYFDVWNFHEEWMKKISHYDHQWDAYDSVNAMSVTLLSNKNTPFQTFHFTGVFPVSLGNLEFDPTEGQEILVMPVQYAFLDLYKSNVSR